MEPFHLNLAVQAYINHKVTKAPNVDTLLDLAKECNGKNAFLLPSMGGGNGAMGAAVDTSQHQVLLPPERYCLSKMNYQLEKNKRPRTQ